MTALLIPEYTGSDRLHPTDEALLKRTHGRVYFRYR